MERGKEREKRKRGGERENVCIIRRHLLFEARRRSIFGRTKEFIGRGTGALFHRLSGTARRDAESILEKPRSILGCTEGPLEGQRGIP